jgi:[acyl-carrier-protein] S-malonyltransferase
MKLAFVFPGQGSQSVGMLRDYLDLPVVRTTIDEASSALGQDLFALVENGPEEALNQTTNTQPIMLAADIAVYRAWQALGGPAPVLAAGHSLGEYAALVAGGALGFAEAMKLVRVRADAMQQAVPEGQGGIAAILGLDADLVAAACAEAAGDEVVSPANLNAPGQIVIAGGKAAVGRAIEACKARGAKRAVLLPMSVPSHCALMRPAAETLAGALAGIALKSPAFPIINNVDVREATTPAEIADALVRQLYCPVRWIEIVAAMQAAGVTHIVECGPGKVLHGMVRRIATDVTSATLSSAQAIADTLASIGQTGETA